MIFLVFFITFYGTYSGQRNLDKSVLFIAVFFT